MIAWRRAVIALAITLAAALYLFGVGGYPLLDPDEGRNAEVAREMAETNDYLHPRLNGLPYLDKPLLYFAATAIAIETLGRSEGAVRLPSLLFTLGTVGVVGWFGRRMFGTGAGWVAAAATAATPFTLAYSRTVIFDAALTLWVAVALAASYWAIEEYPRGGPKWRAIAWAAMALGVLTKGPIALVLPAIVAVPYALWRRRVRALADPVSALLFVAILLPWILTMERAVPGFLRYALVTETAARVATPALGRNEPFWYFLVILPAAALPWTIVAATGWAARWWSTRPPVRRERVAESGGTARPTVFLALWIAVPLVFFTVSQSKRPQYVLPLIPAVALSVEALWRGAGGGLPGARAGALGLAVLGGFLLAARDTLSEWIPAAGERVASLIPAAALAIGTVALGAGAAAWLGARHRGVVVGALSLPVLAIPVAGGPLLRAIAEDRTARPLAEAIASQAGDAQVIAIEALPLSLPYYLGRTVVLATDDGVPLTSNYLVRHWAQWGATPSAPVREREWWREALASCTRPRAFVVRADDADVRTELAANLPLLALTRKHVVYGPCGAADGERMLARSADRRTGGPAVRGSSTFPVQRSVGPPVRREWVAGAAGSAGPPGTGGVAGWDRP